jgi:hypothetical protein
MYLGTNIPFYGLVTWLPLCLKEQRHISFGMVGLILTTANVLSIVVMVLVGICQTGECGGRRSPRPASG